MSLRSKSVWTIGGGKGGVGKSFLAASLGTALARAGRSVVLVDANLAAPDLHAHIGVKNPDLTLLDVLQQRARPADVLIPTQEPRMTFLSCVNDEPGMADQTDTVRQSMAEFLVSLDAEFVVIDVGSGTTRGVLDFFNLGHRAVVITSPEAASMRCTYRFIRNALFRRVEQQFGASPEVKSALGGVHQQPGSAQPPTMTNFFDLLWPSAPDLAMNIADMLRDWRPFLLVNMAESEQKLRSAEIIHSTVRKFLNVELQYCGPIPFDSSLRKPQQGKRLPDCGDPESPLDRQIQQAAAQLAAIQTHAQEEPREKAPAPAPHSQAMGLNDNLALLGRALHIQTEDLGAAGNCIITQVFCEGRVVFSTRSEYAPALREKHPNDHLVELMRNQHLSVIRQIESLQLRHQTGAA